MSMNVVFFLVMFFVGASCNYLSAGLTLSRTVYQKPVVAKATPQLEAIAPDFMDLKHEEDSIKTILSEITLCCLAYLPESKMHDEKRLLKNLALFFSELEKYSLDNQFKSLSELNSILLLCDSLSYDFVNNLWSVLLDYNSKLSHFAVEEDSKKEHVAQETLTFLKKLSMFLEDSVSVQKSLIFEQKFFYESLIDFWIPNVSSFKKIVGLNNNDDQETNTKDLSESMVQLLFTAVDKLVWLPEQVIHGFNDFCNLLNMIVNSVDKDLFSQESTFLLLRSKIIARFRFFLEKNYDKLSLSIYEPWKSAVERGELDNILGRESESGKNILLRVLKHYDLLLNQRDRKVEKIGKKGTRVL